MIRANAEAEVMQQPLRAVRKFFSSLGLGFVAGASNNDPTSVAVLSVIGFTTTYGLLWLVVLVIPMLTIIQVASSRVGLVTGQSLQRVIRTRFGRLWAIVSMLLVVIVNVITIAADLEGGGAALSLLFGGTWRYFVPPLAALSVGILLFGRYRHFQRYLRFVLVIFVAYVGAALLARPDWGEVLRHTFVPTFQFTPAYVAGSLALLGSSLSSYVYYWITIEEEEERPPRERLGAVQLDAAVGITFSSVLFWFIVVSAGAAVRAEGAQMPTAQDLPIALAPLAGRYAGAVFALGLLASALFVLPVLAATTAYVAVETFGKRGSVEEPINRASLPFYSVIVLSLAVGVGLSFLGIEPVRLLFLAGIASGLGTPALLVLLFRAAGAEDVMGQDRARGPLKVGGWFAAVVMSLASVVYLAFEWFG